MCGKSDNEKHNLKQEIFIQNALDVFFNIKSI